MTESKIAQQNGSDHNQDEATAASPVSQTGKASQQGGSKSSKAAPTNGQAPANPSGPSKADAEGDAEQVRIRKEKRERLLAQGIQPYPVELPITATIKAVRDTYQHLATGEETDDMVGIAGRVMLMRNGGKLCFATLQDGAGNRIQIMLSAKEVGADSLTAYKADVDLGDHLFVHGRVISSKRGELSIMAQPGTPDEHVPFSHDPAQPQRPSLASETAPAASLNEAPAASGAPADPAPAAGTNANPAQASSTETGVGQSEQEIPAWKIAAKALRPLPKTFTAEDGTEMSLSEDMRIRRRYLDMITRPAARDMVRLRANVVKSLRAYFDQAGFVEIETPMLQTLHGGAAARPFKTHMNAYDTDLYLRIAPELYLKRAAVGGVEKVFEINRNFRNEGADSSHSPEFTMLEAYEAYGNYNTMARRTREFIQQAARDALGTEHVTLPDGTIYDLSGDWTSIDLYGATSEAVGHQLSPRTPREELVRIAEELGEDIPDHYVPGKIVEVIFEKTVGDKLWAPTFVRDFPEDSSPLVRNHRSKPGQVEKWDLYVRGFELATAYSELVDPVIQRQRFEEQALAAANGDPEAMVLDEDFLMAMEYAAPPMGGMGMGLDRLLMTLTGQGIRETITFPLVKRI